MCRVCDEGEGTMSRTVADRVEESLPWFRERLVALGRCLVLHLLVYPGLLCAALAGFAFVGLGFGVGAFLLPLTVLAVRRMADQRRGLVTRWTGTVVDAPYPRRPVFPAGATGVRQWVRWLRADPATRRDLTWLLLDPVVGGLLALLPVALVLEGVYGFVVCANVRWMSSTGYGNWFVLMHAHYGHGGDLAAISAMGVGLVLLGLWSAPKVLPVYGRWTRSLLAPTSEAQLASRVRQLTETRSEAVDAQAAELRRIERDLHDGAQARLVSMGMNLSAAAQLLEKHPEEAKEMLLEARNASAQALSELRDLVRGIHPPVLSDRGLGDAVRALALDSALTVEVGVDLPGRLEAPVESAAYFTAAEALANAAKHSGGQRVWIDIQHRDGRLLMTIQDDGAGGADPAKGGGLRGLERRLAPFDGILALNSPVGGPTVLTVELPCELS